MTITNGNRCTNCGHAKDAHDFAGCRDCSKTLRNVDTGAVTTFQCMCSAFVACCSHGADHVHIPEGTTIVFEDTGPIHGVARSDR